VYRLIHRRIFCVHEVWHTHALSICFFICASISLSSSFSFSFPCSIALSLAVILALYVISPCSPSRARSLYLFFPRSHVLSHTHTSSALSCMCSRACTLSKSLALTLELSCACTRMGAPRARFPVFFHVLTYWTQIHDTDTITIRFIY